MVSGHAEGGEVLNYQWCTSLAPHASALKGPAKPLPVKVHHGDGTSPTVNAVNGNGPVSHAPILKTVIGNYEGTQVNLEVDLIARYLERLLQVIRPQKVGGSA